MRTRRGSVEAVAGDAVGESSSISCTEDTDAFPGRPFSFSLSDSGRILVGVLESRLSCASSVSSCSSSTDVADVLGVRVPVRVAVIEPDARLVDPLLLALIDFLLISLTPLLILLPSTVE